MFLVVCMSKSFFKKLKADLIADLIARIISAVLEDLLNFTGILEVH